MKKIGIITHYYGSKNYGGLLQAYALCRVLNDSGYEAEQISYDLSTYKPFQLSLVNLKGAIRDQLSIAYHYMLDQKIKKLIDCRKDAIRSFAKLIPHSNNVYNDITIEQCNDVYDIFITGSDQVWNIDWYYPAYFLNFVTANKIKMSYAASVSKNELTVEQALVIKEHLSDYKAISVREQSTVGLLSDISPVPVQWTLDPTLLLSDDQWDEICSPRLIDEKYVFCYFLGNSEESRNIATQFAKRHCLKLVTLPYLSGHYRACDRKFGEIQLFDIGYTQNTIEKPIEIKVEVLEVYPGLISNDVYIYDIRFGFDILFNSTSLDTVVLYSIASFVSVSPL